MADANPPTLPVTPTNNQQEDRTNLLHHALGRNPKTSEDWGTQATGGSPTPAEQHTATFRTSVNDGIKWSIDHSLLTKKR